jgi:hypothetical protein
MSFWQKLTSWVHGAAVKASTVFVTIFGVQAAQQFAQGALALLKTAEGQLAVDAVEAVSSLSLDAAGKRAAAFDKLNSDFKTQGKTVGDSIINLLIETAVSFVKGHVGPA